MVKDFIQRHIPSPERIASMPGMHRFGSRITDPSLWHINRRSVAGAMFWGTLCAWIPFPSQMLIATVCAIIFRVNLPLCIALTWIFNPFTIIPILYSSYWIGAHILGVPVLSLHQIADLLVYLTTQILSDTPAPIHTFSVRAMLLGLWVEAITLASLATVSVRLLWRWHVVHQWRNRHKK